MENQVAQISLLRLVEATFLKELDDFLAISSELSSVLRNADEKNDFYCVDVTFFKQVDISLSYNHIDVFKINNFRCIFKLLNR